MHILRKHRTIAQIDGHGEVHYIETEYDEIKEILTKFIKFAEIIGQNVQHHNYYITITVTFLLLTRLT